MTGPVEASGRTVEEAIDAALELLGAREDEVEIQILSEGEDLGPLHRGDARVLVRFRDERSEEDHIVAREAEQHERRERRRVAPEDAERHATSVNEFLSGLLEAMQIDASVDVSATESGAAATISGQDLGVLIGRHGATLAALQEISRAVAQRTTESRPTVIVDVEHYLERRQESLERIARAAAVKVRKFRREIALEPMNARDRKLVHDALTSFSGVRTSSEGEEPNRYVVVSPA